MLSILDDSTIEKLNKMKEVDEKILESKPWVRDLLAEAQNVTRAGILKWSNIVTEIGESSLDLDKYMQILVKHLADLFQDFIVDIESLKAKQIDQITKLMEQLNQLRFDLGVEFPEFDDDKVILEELKSETIAKIELYSAEVRVRRKDLDQLLERELDLCASLGRSPEDFKQSPLPTDEQLEAFRKRVELLDDERLEREEQFLQMREEIATMLAELEAEPRSDFESRIFSLRSSQVMITDNEMRLLHELHERTKRSFELSQSIATDLRCKLNSLWERLDVDMVQRGEFLSRYKGFGAGALAALKEEIERCEVIKRENLKAFIDRQKEHLVEMWKKCHCVLQKEEEMFTVYDSSLYNEDLFDLFEMEIQKWRKHYEEHRGLYEALEQHTALWKQYEELEEKAEGSSRYKNRGGQLLQEEKLRNKFNKQIPIVERKLVKLAENYERAQGAPFLTFGETVVEHLERLHAAFKQNAKSKLSAKKYQREITLAAVKSPKNLFATPTLSRSPLKATFSSHMTPMASGNKRKMFVTPQTSDMSKRKKIGSATVEAVKAVVPKIVVTRVPKTRRSIKGKKTNKVGSWRKSNNATFTNEYKKFETEVSQLKSRSTEHGLPGTSKD